LPALRWLTVNGVWQPGHANLIGPLAVWGPDAALKRGGAARAGSGGAGGGGADGVGVSTFAPPSVSRSSPRMVLGRAGGVGTWTRWPQTLHSAFFPASRSFTV
jgi:hypothetical protein